MPDETLPPLPGPEGQMPPVPDDISGLEALEAARRIIDGSPDQAPEGPAANPLKQAADAVNLAKNPDLVSGIAADALPAISRATGQIGDRLRAARREDRRMRDLRLLGESATGGPGIVRSMRRRGGFGGFGLKRPGAQTDGSSAAPEPGETPPPASQ